MAEVVAARSFASMEAELGRSRRTAYVSAGRAVLAVQAVRAARAGPVALEVDSAYAVDRVALPEDDIHSPEIGPC